ncbi:MAG: hypothetical protein FJ088_16310 [Deltaproteobacteria bacterium]|nr:hypothetical protein [Deltaproteobacteria bacterium]
MIFSIFLLFFLSCSPGSGGSGDDVFSYDSQCEFQEEAAVPEYPACETPFHCKWGEWCKGDLCEKAVNPPGALAKDFTLEDVQKKSPTYGKEITLSDSKGYVILLYFALAT